MPCHRCGARQSDPARGPSAWKRGVRRGSQVLVCPECQHDRDWTADLDRCPSCGSTALLRTLGETSCRGCGAMPGGPPAPTGADPVDAPGLAEDVARAIDRVLYGDIVR